MLNARFLGGALLGSVLLGFVFTSMRSSPKLSFQIYPNLKTEHIDAAETKKIIKIHHACFDEPRSTNYLNYAKKHLYLGQSKATREFVVKNQLKRMSESIDQTFHETKNVSVLRNKGEIVGFYSCEERSVDFDNAAVIWNLCVAPKARGQGFGKELTKHAIKTCSRKGQDLVLLVYKDNERAKNLYKKQGFIRVPWDYDADNDPGFYNKDLMKYKEKAPHLKN